MTTLSNAGQVLRCFSVDRQELTVTEVSQLLQLPKSNVSRLLRAMRDAGLLENVAEGRGYRPGLLMFELGQNFRRDTALISRAHAAVTRLCRRFGHAGYISVRQGADVIGLTFQEGSQATRIGTPVGLRLPAFAAASGRALLARLHDGEVCRLFPGPLQFPSAQAPRTQEELLRRLAEIRRLGYAVALNEAHAGVGSIAVAVGSGTEEDLCLCIVFPVATVDIAERQSIAAALMAEARDVARPVRRPLPMTRAAA